MKSFGAGECIKLTPILWCSAQHQPFLRAVERIPERLPPALGRFFERRKLVRVLAGVLGHFHRNFPHCLPLPARGEEGDLVRDNLLFESRRRAATSTRDFAGPRTDGTRRTAEHTRPSLETTVILELNKFGVGSSTLFRS